MNQKDKKLYKRIIDICHREWLRDHSHFDADKNRYILEFSDSYLFVYLTNGKVNLSTKGKLTPIFKSSKIPMLTGGINEKLNELYK